MPSYVTLYQPLLEICRTVEQQRPATSNSWSLFSRFWQHPIWLPNAWPHDSAKGDWDWPRALFVRHLLLQIISSKFMLAWNWTILLQLHVLKYWSLGLRCSRNPFCQPLPKWIQYLPADIIDRATHSQRHGQKVSCYRQTAKHIESQKSRQSHT